MVVIDSVDFAIASHTGKTAEALQLNTDVGLAGLLQTSTLRAARIVEELKRWRN